VDSVGFGHHEESCLPIDQAAQGVQLANRIDSVHRCQITMRTGLRASSVSVDAVALFEVAT